VIIDTQNAAHYTWGEVCDGWHLVKSPEISVIQERVPPGAQEVRHTHQQAWQFFYILGGQATFELDSVIYTLNAGQGIEVPPGKAHQLMNRADQDLHFLVISRPPSHGDRILA